MKLENKVLFLDPSIDQEQLQKLVDELKVHIDEIEEVVIEDRQAIATSGLISLLMSLKNTKESIKIPYLDGENYNFAGIGNVTFVEQR